MACLRKVIAGLGVLFLAFLFCLPLAAQQARWDELNGQVEKLLKDGKFSDALPLAQEALRAAEASFGAEDPRVATALTSLGDAFRWQGKYAEAVPLYQRGLAIREKALGPGDPLVARSLAGLALLYNSQGKYAQAEPLYQRALAIMEKASAPDHDLAVGLNNLANVYYNQGKYAQAEPLYQRALAIREKALGPEHPDVAVTLNSLANLYGDLGRYAQAEPLFQRALAIREKALGPEHPDVAESLTNLANEYEDEGRYAQAEALYQRALAIYEKALGPEHPIFAAVLNNLAIVYDDEGKYPQAEALYRRGLAIREKALGPEHVDITPSLLSLAGVYREQGRYAEAEPLYQRALAIREKALGPEHPDVAKALNSLALLYYSQGKYAQAEPLYQRSLAIREKALGPEHPDVSKPLINLGALYVAQGKYAKAEPLYQRALAIREKALGPEHPELAYPLIDLAEVYGHEGRYAEAEVPLSRALAISEKALGPEHPLVADALSTLVEMSIPQGRYAQAEPVCQRALAIREKALGPDHPAVGDSLMDCATLYYGQGLPSRAEPLFERALQNVGKRFEYHFTYMNEKERLQFLDKVADTFPTYFSFCFTYRQTNPELVGRMYDVLLWEKGFVGRSIAALRSQIAASGDKGALSLLEQVAARKTQLAKLLTTEPKDRAEWKKQVEQLERETDELERALVKRSSSYAERKRLARVSWRDVQKALAPDEAAVEFVRFRFHDGKKFTDTSYYAALIVTPKSTTAPTFVLLGEAKQIEGAPLVDYQRRVKLQGAGTRTAVAAGSFYNALWQPLEAPLAGAERIYLSPDGILNQISLGLVPANDGQLMMEKYHLRLLSSTADLLREKPKRGTDTAVLIGNPQFDLDEAQQRAQVRGLKKPEESETLLASAAPLAGVASGLRSRDKEGDLLPPLPGTKGELESVRSLLEKQQWQVEVYTESKALKEVIERVEHPRVLHVATHAFFLHDQIRLRNTTSADLPSGMEDPMVRSGLFFAGANRALAGTPSPADLEDGVLTAYEATGLSLQGTELVVLSACDTGLGQVKNGEGVFGLRRAFEEAGAQSVLMSLWSVPDRETQELMTLFYSKWLAGEDKPEALRGAQLEMRERVKARYGQDLPFYWGAFVLVGR